MNDSISSPHSILDGAVSQAEAQTVRDLVVTSSPTFAEVNISGGAGYRIDGCTVFNTAPANGNSPIFIGVNAGARYPELRNNAWDIGIGSQALSSWAGIGTECVAIGTWAGRYLSSGFGANTLVGQVALGSDSSGSANTAVGRDVMYLQQDASFNVAVGFDALKMGSVSNSVAIGSSALAGNSSSLALSGMVTPGDVLTLNYKSAAVNGGSEVQVSYTVQVADTLSSIAFKWAEAITTNLHLKRPVRGPAACNAASFGPNIALNWAGTQTSGPVQPVISVTTNDGATEVVTVANGNTGSGNVAVGYNAMRGSTLSTATYNVGVGQGSLEGLSTGNHNTAVGTFSGRALTSASRSTLVGFNVAPALITGSDMVVVGANACVSATTAEQSVVIGSNAAARTTTSSHMVVIGYQALANGMTTGGSGTVAVGNHAAHNASVAITAVGSQAGRNLTTGMHNIAIGNSALRGAPGSTARLNNVIGDNSMTLATSAAGNNSLGCSNGLAVTSGSYNVLIGNAVATHGLVAGSNNIFISSCTSGYSPAHDVSDSLWIGGDRTGAITGTLIGKPVIHFPGGLITIGESGRPTISSGTGAPTSIQPNGSIYLRADGAVSSRLYVSQGAGSWSAIASS